MPRFFLPGGTPGDSLTLTGADAAHIARVLRMRPGERLTVCDCRGRDYLCEIVEARPEAVTARVLAVEETLSEPNIRVTLYQALPKGDKMDFIIQKSVELGAARIVPVLTSRSVARPDEKSLLHKTQRWNRIAAEAAGQSGRGVLPQVEVLLRFEEALERLLSHGTPLMLYERDGGTLRTHLDAVRPDALRDIGVLVGPEGGFSEAEAELARVRGVKTAGMGPRILRTETAPLCALSAIMYATGNL